MSLAPATPVLMLLVLTALWAQPVTAQEGQVGRSARINGIEMHYEEQGAGEPLVLLHGFGSCGRQWQPFVERFADQFRLVIPDLRSHGRSTGAAAEFTHRQAAADVLGLLDHLGITRFRAMGISTGGMTLLHVATRQPQRVDAMVLIGATHYFPEQARAIMREEAESGPSPRHLEYLRQCESRGDVQVRDLARRFGELKDSYDDMNFTVPYLGTIKARTLIVHGDRDEFFPVSIAVEMYEAIPGSALWIVPRGGHVPVFGPHARQFQEIAIPFLRGEEASR